MGGLSLALALDKRGLTNWMIFEKADGVGGTWWTNRYPGCRCDVPAIAYQHSAHLNPAWSETHPERAEIQHYWEALARGEGLWPRIKLRYTAVRAEWDASDAAYYVVMRSGDGEEHIYRADVLVNACGMLSTPRAGVPGAESFGGRVMHAADWPADLPAEDLRGRVVVVGNGCSGVQIVGALSALPVDVTVVAHTRQWFVPSPRGAPRHSVLHTPSQIARWRRWPLLLRLERVRAQWRMDAKFAWYRTREGAAARKRMEEGIGAWMRAALPEYMRDTVPSYSFGARRLIYEDGYFDALKRNARFVDGRVERITRGSVVLSDGREIPADTIVLATGYDAAAVAFPVVGDADATGNYASRTEWTVYRGIAMPGIPNFFTVFGNNMYLNHISVSSVLEIQAAYIARIVAAMRDHGVRRLAVTRAAADAYHTWLDERLRLMVWYEVASFWRAGGTGRIFTHYPGSVKRLWWENTWPRWDDWEGAEPMRRWRRIRRVLWLLVVVVAAWVSRGRVLGQRIASILAPRVRVLAAMEAVRRRIADSK
ncbi:FAD/NAD(P)-binding domain-containing protein [Cutaneotrichosporon oleaginosum]|uniref:FAD/NAD(P)-binding domain-containing protein n=1 Tax=Cutaneotrichosporon oleaginosum TaxID=879819 RepID=A0A0J1AY22_9TREE|nr:FAD/NAD(P)-binding domain-containing protein [Cutaneotrichosporon oleaginosum]KLT40229.1 FAD/NAD(P)-binding domain-containing protein [Cutaneotrichosporon oleaginosum]